MGDIMGLSTVLRALAFAGATILLTACEYSPNTVDRTIAFNRAVAESTNQLILLNAIRSSKRNPTYYSRLSGDNTTSIVAPGITAMLPFIGTKSVTDTISKGSTHGSSIATAVARAVPSLTTGLTITEENQLALVNSDDQGSITGLMTPVPMQVYQYFQSEGFNREELLLMFLGSVTLTEAQLEELANLASAHCSEVPSFPMNTWCANYIDQTRPSAAIDSKAVIPSDCLDPNSLTDAQKVKTSAVFVNDPALSNSAGFHNLACFQSVERALLAVGLRPKSITTHTVVYRVPLETARNNPRFLADLSQQGLEVAFLP
jgi:hypothetical protein